jgi:hypothetical protein
MKIEKLKETLFAMGTYTFLFLFYYSFINNCNWTSFQDYIGALGLILVIAYLERSQSVLTKKYYFLVRVLALIISILLQVFIISK